jgi:hypothetical protein
LGLVFGQYSVAYENAISENKSWEIVASYVKIGSQNLYITGFGGSLQYRFFLSSSDAPKGLFVAPVVGARFLEYKDSAADATLVSFKFTTLTVGAIIGYQWLFSDDRFSLELSAGPGYVHYFAPTVAKNTNIGGSILPIGSISLGYRLVE